MPMMRFLVLILVFTYPFFELVTIVFTKLALLHIHLSLNFVFISDPAILPMAFLWSRFAMALGFFWMAFKSFDMRRIL